MCQVLEAWHVREVLTTHFGQNPALELKIVERSIERRNRKGRGTCGGSKLVDIVMA